MNDERLKRAGGGSYFDELLARIRDIRSSEKVFWRKVLEMYAASIDYFVTDFMQDHSTAAVARVASPTLDGRKKAVARAQLAIRSVQ